MLSNGKRYFKRLKLVNIFVVFYFFVLSRLKMEIANKLNTCVYTLFGFDRFECEQCHEDVGGN